MDGEVLGVNLALVVDFFEGADGADHIDFPRAEGHLRDRPKSASRCSISGVEGPWALVADVAHVDP